MALRPLVSPIVVVPTARDVAKPNVWYVTPVARSAPLMAMMSGRPPGLAATFTPMQSALQLAPLIVAVKVPCARVAIPRNAGQESAVPPPEPPPVPDELLGLVDEDPPHATSGPSRQTITNVRMRSPCGAHMW